jgi:hydrogen cyanide synthase HcnC
MSRSPDVVVIGGGVIGSAVAHYTARRGLFVTIIDQPKRGRATSASAGGLWPLGESVGLGCGVIFYKTLLAKGGGPHGTNGGPAQLPRAFLDFAIASNAMFPRLAEELREANGIDIEYERTALLFLMYDEGDEAFARPLWQSCPCGRTLTDWLTPEEVAREEPYLTGELRGALRFRGDDQVNPYRLANALLTAARAHGATVLPHTEVVGLARSGRRITGVRIKDRTIPCGTVVNAAGAWAGEIGAMAGLEIPVRPVRGQIVATETLPKILSACISTTACYLAQKGHGEVIIGSTTEEAGFNVGVTAEAIASLSAGAVRAVPFLGEVTIKRVWAGLRPGSPDELPILGPVDGLDGYLNACGHFRTGILNAPLTGLVIAELAAGERPSQPIEPFLLSRFGRRLSSASSAAPTMIPLQ